MTVIKKHDGTDWQEVVVGESGQWNSAQTIRAETASTVLTSADAGSVIVMNSSSATAITVNGPTSFSPGQRVDFLRQGTGNVVIGGSGVTINATPGLKLRARYSGASLLCIRPNVYVLTGDLDEAFSPLSLSPALWMDAADTSTITEASGSVSQWDNKGSLGDFTQATAASQPTTGASTQNGLNVIDFAGDFLGSADAASSYAFTVQAAQWHSFVVFKAGTVANPNTAYVLFGTRIVSPFTYHAVYYDDRTSSSRNDQLVVDTANAGAVVAQNRLNDTATPNVWHTAAITNDFGNATAADRSTIVIDGGTPIKENTATATPSTGNPSGVFEIGRASVLPLTGSIAEIILVDRAMNATEIAITTDYLKTKWGTP